MARPSAPLLDRERIGAAALALVDADGDFSMPALARALGVSPSSLYHHVSGRHDVVELVRARVVSPVDHSAFGRLPWDAAMQHWLSSYLAAFASHPAAIRLLATTQQRDPVTMAMYEVAASALLDAGFERRTVLALITAGEHLVLGAALDTAAPTAMVDPAAAAGYPVLRGVVRAAPRGARRARQAFDVGVEALVTGYRALLLAQTRE